MLIKPLIKRLRETVGTIFSDRVDGASGYFEAIDKSRLVIPSLFVMYAGSSATTLNHHPDYLADLEERIKIIAILDNSTDRTGKNAQNKLHIVREAIFQSILNYHYDNNAHTFEFVGDRMIELTNAAQYVHEFEFRQISRIGAEEGAQLQLDNFDKYYADWNLPESDEENHPDAQDQIENIYNS